MRAALRRFLCGLRGHDAVLNFDVGMQLHCASCGWRSKGWNVVAFTPSPEARARSIKRRFSRRMQEQ